MKYTVIRDTKEKENFGWWFDKGDRCEGTVRRKLRTGDYSLEGYEKLFTIERKASTAEVALNIWEKRFEKELVRMREFQYAFMIFEFNFEDIMTFPVNSGIPRNKWDQIRTTPQSLLMQLTAFQVKYGVPIIYAGKYGADVASSLFKRIIENVKIPRECT